MILVICPNPSVDSFMELDTFKPFETNRAKSEVHFPGGKGVHVAMAIAEYGEQVCLLGFWGGPTGTWIKQQCESLGIECIGPFQEMWNRFCITIIQEGPCNETELLGTGPAIKKEQLDTCYEAFDTYLDAASLVILSGSLPPKCPTDFYARLIRSAHSKHKKCLIDTTGEALNEALKTQPLGIHLNEPESQQMTGTTDINQIMKRLNTQTELKIITQGVKGLYLGTNDGLFHANIELNQVLSTVGSGDCLMAGLAVAIHRGYDHEEMARYAVAFGAANCLRKELGMLYKKDVDRLLPQVEVHMSLVNYG